MLEVESLLNDGTAAVLFLVVIDWLGGEQASVARAAERFVVVGLGGLGVGLVIGIVLSWILARVVETTIELSLTILAAYGSFVLAEHLHVSGILATVASGVVCGSYGMRAMADRTRAAVHGFWGLAAFALNSVVFLLVGFSVDVHELRAWWLPIVLAYVSMLAARALVVALVSLALRGTRERIPWRWGVGLAWGGLRGALSMVLALTLPDDFAHKDVVVTVTFGVVVLSIVVNGLTIGPVIRRLGIGGETTEA
jgi:CPA1 family monovalent cation:H+ antiporter